MQARLQGGREMTIIDKIIEAEGDTFKINKAELLELQKLQNGMVGDGDPKFIITDVHLQMVIDKQAVLFYCGKAMRYEE